MPHPIHPNDAPRSRRSALVSGTALGTAAAASLLAGNASAQVATTTGQAGPTKLFSLWTSGDPDVAHRVALMYTHAAKQAGWFEDVKLVIWGPSQRLLVGDKDLKEKIAAMKSDGVVVEACIACARTYGLVEALEALDLPVLGQGEPLSEAMKEPGTSVSFF